VSETCGECGQRLPSDADRIVARLSRARKDQGRSAEDVATQTGCSRQTLWRWEGGSTSPDLRQLDAWARALGVSIALKEDQ
jgi:transcriptional regulator with XRE-family HTH domain